MIEVFHGSTVEVRTPLVLLGRHNLDFGQGFYVTDRKTQAEGWAVRMATRRLASPVLNIYSFDIEAARTGCHYLKFDAYDKAWLDFIAASRKGRMPWKGYDVVEGGVANDNVIDAVEDYLRGRMSAEAALKELSRHQPNNQICILRQEIIDKHLHFVKSINI